MTQIQSAIDTLKTQKKQADQAVAKAKTDLERLRKNKSAQVAKAKAEAEKRISAELNIEQAEAEYAELLDQSRQLQKAINALAPPKKAPTTDLVARILTKLTADGPISVTEATAAIKEQLETKGMVATGLTLRINQALDGSKFNLKNEMISRALPTKADAAQPQHDHGASQADDNHADDAEHLHNPLDQAAQT